MLSAFSRRYDPWKSATDFLFAPNVAQDGARAYRIAFVGNSQIYSDTDWSTSIEDVLEERLNTALASARPIRVIPALAPGVVLKALADFSSTYADSHLYDTIVFQLNTNSLPDLSTVPHAARVVAIERALEALARPLVAAHVPLLVVCEPLPDELSPAEQFWRFTVAGAPPSAAGRERYTELVEAASRSGIAYLDLEPAYLHAEEDPGHSALFGSTESHFSTYGRKVTGERIADFILRAPARWIRPNDVR